MSANTNPHHNFASAEEDERHRLSGLDPLRRLSIDTIGSSSQRSFGHRTLLDPATAVALDAAAHWRLQQQMPTNRGGDNLEMDLLYRTLLQQQNDAFLNQARQRMNQSMNPPAMHHPLNNISNNNNNNLSNSNNGMSNVMGGGGLGVGLDASNPMALGGGGNFDLQYAQRMNQTNHLSNMNNNIDATTLLALQQQQQQQQQHSNNRFALEEQLALMNAMQQQQQQQQQQQFFHLPQPNQVFANYDLDSTGMGNLPDGAPSASLLSALFAEAAAPNLTAQQLTSDAFAAAPMRPALPATKKSKAAAAESSAQLPVRALSAYNFFFRDERDRIISGEDDLDPLHPDSFLQRRQAVPLDADKKKQLLSGHWFRDRTVKRRHRKTHGKIAFTALSKVISQAWRDLPEADKAFYRAVAAEDLERYQREVEQMKFNDTRPAAAEAPLEESSGGPTGV